MNEAELRSLVRRVTITWSDGAVITIDTLAHPDREVQLGSGRPKRIKAVRFERDGVRFCNRADESPTIKVELVPDGAAHEAYVIQEADGRHFIY